MEKEFEVNEQGPKARKHIDSLRATPNWKTPGHDGIHGYWFKKFTTINGRLAIEIY